MKNELENLSKQALLELLSSRDSEINSLSQNNSQKDQKINSLAQEKDALSQENDSLLKEREFSIATIPKITLNRQYFISQFQYFFFRINKTNFGC